MAKKSIDIILTAQDRASRKINGITGTLTRTFGGLRRVAGDVMRGISMGLGFQGLRAVQNVIGSSVTSALDFEQAMSRVKAITGANADEIQRLTDKAHALGRDTMFTATQAANAMNFFALAGFEANQIMAAMGPTLDLAAAGQIDVAEAADIATKILKGMGVPMEELPYALDVLGKAFTTANTDIRMLGDAFKYVGPVANVAGVSLEETTAAIQLLSDAGIQAEMAGTTLRGALMAMSNPSGPAKAAMDELGVSFTEANGAIRPLADVIDDLNAAIDRTGTDPLAAVSRIFTRRTAGGMAALMSAGGGAMRDRQEMLLGSLGTNAKIAQIQLDNTRGSVTMLSSAWDAFTQKVITGPNAMLRPLIDWTTDVVRLMGTEGFMGQLGVSMLNELKIIGINFLRDSQRIWENLKHFFTYEIGHSLVYQFREWGMAAGANLAAGLAAAKTFYGVVIRDIGDSLAAVGIEINEAVGRIDAEEAQAQRDHLQQMHDEQDANAARDLQLRLQNIHREKNARSQALMERQGQELTAARQRRLHELGLIDEKREGEIAAIRAADGEAWQAIFAKAEAAENARNSLGEAAENVALTASNTADTASALNDLSGMGGSLSAASLATMEQSRFLTGAAKSHQDESIRFARKVANASEKTNQLLEKLITNTATGTALPVANKLP